MKEFTVKITHNDGKPKDVTLYRPKAVAGKLWASGGDLKPNETIGQAVDRFLATMA